MTDVYRACASIVVLRPTDVCAPDGCTRLYQVLLLKKPRKKDSWQLPQGGVEQGETTEQAALRELKEEAGISAQILGVSDKVYQYDFPDSFRRFRPDNVCGQRVEYVFAITDGNEPVQVDNKEIESFVWALEEQFPLYLKRKEYLDLVKDLSAEAAKLAEKASSPELSS